MAGFAHDSQTHTRLVVRVLQDVIRRHGAFSTYAEVAEALKDRCARLRLWYDADVISDAIARVELGGRAPIVAPVTRPRLNERPPIDHAIPRDEAAAILENKLGIRLDVKR